MSAGDSARLSRWRWLAVVVPWLGVIGHASAVIVYESPVNRLIFSGRISAFSTWRQGISGDDHDPTNGGTRARLILDHNFGHGWAAVARTEWGFN